MSEFLFPDNTVLCNFAAVERLDLLRMVLDGRGRWTQAVAREARNSAKWLPALNELRQQGWLGEAIRVTEQADRDAILRIRTAVFGGRADRIFQHLGEAETCHVIVNWDRFASSWWISDDKHSLSYAAEQGIFTAETIDMVRLAVKGDLITAQEGFELMQQMKERNRNPRMPRSVAELE
ncbi:hypothetical protein ACFQ2B_08085 [Streptomyces stramineus]|uniref:PIN domain-containing protein n=1 Tax=Streptomyces stramineus TaxID=173861 RepID=A0ABP3JT76_9ACTN